MTKRKVGMVWPASSKEIVKEKMRWPGTTSSSRILNMFVITAVSMLTRKTKTISNLAVLECWSAPQRVEVGEGQQDAWEHFQCGVIYEDK